MPAEPRVSARSAPVDNLELWLEPVAGGRRVRVPDGGPPFVIGRHRTSGLVISDPSCSREHASVRREAGVIWLEPLSLRQPTLVNGTPHDRPVQLASGDVLRFGDIEVRVQLTPGQSAGATAARLTPPPSWSPDRASAGQTQLDDGELRTRARLDTASISISDTLVIGRKVDPKENGLALNHPTVSLRHAVVLRANGLLSIRDLGSTNGTFVNGSRVQGTQSLHDGALIRIGPFTFKVAGETLVPYGEDEDLAQLSANGVVLEVSADGGRKQLLRDVSVGIRAKEFVAIIGPSGCGKSTLIRILSGRALPTQGSVSWKATDLHRSFDALKSDIAFVPQREMLLEQLTVRQALTYTARLRLAADVTPEERGQIVEETIARVGLQEQAELPISRLSGGQRKRAGLANELLVSPKLMFLDEVTSGLDEATDREMMALFRNLADSGIAVVCVTHTLANVEGTCDSLLVMARGGTVAYHGPLAGVRAHFEVDQLGDIYGSLESRPATAWHERHVSRSPYQGRVTTGAMLTGQAASSLAIAAAPRDRRAPLSQLWVLLERYLEVTFADRRTLAMAGLQSIVIAGFLRLVFGDDATAPPKEYLLVFLLGVSAFWFGCNNAAKEIVKERSLFHLERDVNLRIPSYLWSKVVVLGFIGILQTALLFAAVRLMGLTFEHAVGNLGIMVLTVLAGTTCGLLISAAAGSEDQAITIVPIALIPQLLLSGAVVSPLTHAASIVAKTGITAYWTYRSQQNLLSATNVDGTSAAWMLAAHVAGYALLTLAVLWWRERTRRH
jgi:ABC transport system ATP-binding/permease protein